MLVPDYDENVIYSNQLSYFLLCLFILFELLYIVATVIFLFSKCQYIFGLILYSLIYYDILFELSFCIFKQ